MIKFCATIPMERMINAIILPKDDGTEGWGNFNSLKTTNINLETINKYRPKAIKHNESVFVFEYNNASSLVSKITNNDTSLSYTYGEYNGVEKPIQTISYSNSAIGATDVISASFEYLDDIAQLDFDNGSKVYFKKTSFEGLTVGMYSDNDCSNESLIKEFMYDSDSNSIRIKSRARINMDESVPVSGKVLEINTTNIVNYDDKGKIVNRVDDYMYMQVLDIIEGETTFTKNNMNNTEMLLKSPYNEYLSSTSNYQYEEVDGDDILKEIIIMNATVECDNGNIRLRSNPDRVNFMY